MLDEIRKKQVEFQKFVGFPVESKLDSDRNEMAEKYLFKAMEEIIELRREFPSMMNPWSKEQKDANLQRIKEELSDVLLFLTNFANVWKLPTEDILSTMREVQYNNFRRAKEKKIDKLNAEMMKIPGYTIGIGHGSMNPLNIFVGQNPGKDIAHGYKVWSNVEDGSSRVLLPILEAVGMLDNSYFTNLVKSTTIDNEAPSEDLVDFWVPFLQKEIEILSAGNGNPYVYALGNYTSGELIRHGIVHTKLTHPAAILRGTKTRDNYRKEVTDAFALNHRG